jgi:hypothetical protein
MRVTNGARGKTWDSSQWKSLFQSGTYVGFWSIAQANDCYRRHHGTTASGRKPSFTDDRYRP